MTTDFNYNNKTIDSGGPIKPSGTDQPGDPRTRVDFYSDIKLIPNPYVGMIITVKTDETNQNKMTDYKVLSLKPNSLGIANSVIDRVQRYAEYLGVSTGGSSSSGTGLTSEQEEQLNKIPEMEASINNINETLNTKANTSDIPTNTSELYNDSGFLTSIPSEYITETEMNEAIANVSSGGSVSQEDINTAVNNYLTEHPIASGATSEQAAQIEANKTAIGDANSGLIKGLNDIKNIELENLNTAIQTLETLVGDKSGLPEGDANIIASINRIDAKDSGLTSEQKNNAADNIILNDSLKTLNLTPLKDINGNYFNCHGLGILFYNGVYYAYGESKTGVTQKPGSATAFIPTTGVNCYSSTDLINWKFENKVLKPNTEDSTSVLYTDKVIERPKVIYNEKNNNFVMIFHSDTSDYKFARIGIASCDTPTGNFTLIGTYRPSLPNSTARDLTAFVDDDKTAYVFVSRDNNTSLYCHKLNDDYTGFTDEYSIVIRNGNREAPAVFKYDGSYYIMTSGLSGWNPNPTRIYKSSTINGTYVDEGLTCLNDTNSNSYGSQPTFVLPVDENKYGYKFIAMFDKWNTQDLSQSSYLWLPLILQDGKFYVDNVNINKFTIPSKSMDLIVNNSSNFFYGKSYEYALNYLYNLINNQDYISVTSVSLSTNSLSLNKGSTTSIEYTVLPANATNKTVTWNSSRSDIATVDTEGNIEAISEGECTITLTSNDNPSAIASCTITVNASPSTEPTDYIYSLPSVKTFNASNSDFVDTGVQLFDTDKDFTIFLDFEGSTNNTATSNAHTLLHCMHETSPWNGLSFAISAGGYQIDYQGNTTRNKWNNFSINYNNTNNHKIVIVKNAGENSLKLYYDQYSTQYTLTGAHVFTPINENLLLGCYQQTTGGKGRFWNGTINDFKVYFKALNDTEIENLFV